MNEICILSAPRSGTNHMCALWNGFRGHASFAEIFHRKSAYGCAAHLAALNRAFGIEATGIDDPLLTGHMRDDPVKAVTALGASCAEEGHESFSYKIFPSHLKPDRLRALLDRDGVVFVIVKRLLIDCFISSRKAQLVQSWTGVDTTGRAVALDFDEFANWAASRRQWFSRVESWLTEAGRPFAVLTYEADINCEPAQHMEVAREVIGGLGLDLTVTAEMRSKHRKQDTSQNYHAKVTNWRAFCREARRRGQMEQLWRHP